MAYADALGSAKTPCAHEARLPAFPHRSCTHAVTNTMRTSTTTCQFVVNADNVQRSASHAFLHAFRRGRGRTTVCDDTRVLFSLSTALSKPTLSSVPVEERCRLPRLNQPHGSPRRIQPRGSSLTMAATGAPAGDGGRQSWTSLCSDFDSWVCIRLPTFVFRWPPTFVFRWPTFGCPERAACRVCLAPSPRARCRCRADYMSPR
jgi:hypothetical protein